MIKLVVISNSSPAKAYRFDRDVIIIGKQGSPSADLSLIEDLLDQHLQIAKVTIENEVRFIATNLAHDPFVTINGMAFGKRQLQEGDTIQIGDTSLTFESEQDVNLLDLAENDPSVKIESENSQIEVQETGKIVPITPFVQKMTKSPFVTSPPNFNVENAQPVHQENEKEFSSSVDLSNSQEQTTHNPLPITQSVKQVIMTPLHDNKPKKVPTIPPKLERTIGNIGPFNQLHISNAKSSPLPRTQKLSLKDYYLSEYDEEGETDNSISRIQKAKTSKNGQETSPSGKSSSTEHGFWKRRLKIIGSALGLILFFVGISILSITHHSGDAEIRAARSIADVAMALSYADIKNIHPKNQNWSDPEFIHNTLYSVLGPEYTSLADFDSQGLFHSSSYMLRIYTSSNLSQFLVIAQPAPSLLQWLAPKAPIIIDSRAMEIRKIKDLKALNRLLVNANMSEGAHSEEISDLVKQGELIPLSTLGEKKKNYGFIPSTGLPLIRPGSENFIYNAPRYYMLGHTFLSKTLDIIDNTASHQEIAQFQQELSALAEYPDLVLYTDKGIQSALNAQKALTLLAPKEKFLISYLIFNNNESIIGSHILLDDTPSYNVENDLLNTGGTISSEDLMAINLPKQITETPLFNASIIRPTIDHRDPLFLRLSALAITRQQALNPTYDEIYYLFENEMQSWSPSFESKSLKLQELFLKINSEQHLKISQDLAVIAKDMSYIPASCFMEFIKATNLEQSFQDYLNKLKVRPQPIKISAQDIEANIKLIDSAANWIDLEAYTAQISSLLNFENVPESETLITFQNDIRTHVIKKLNHFLLSTDSEPLPQEAFMPEYRIHLVNILEAAWIIDPETHSFYLDEFDLRSAPMRIFKTSEQTEN